MNELSSHFQFVNSNFPQRPNHKIDKMNLIDLGLKKLSNSDILIFEGEDGIGKTELCAQFCEMNPYNSISLFIQPSNNSSYEKKYVFYELVNQINYLLERRETDFSLLDENDFSSYQFKLKKYLKSNRFQVFYMVIDGIDKIESEKFSKINWLFNSIVSLDPKTVKLVLTGNKKKLNQFFNADRKSIVETIPLPNLTRTELFNLLSEEGYVEEEIKDYFYQVTKGNPQKVASLVNIYKNGTIDPKTSLRKTEMSIEDLFKIQMDQFIQDDSFSEQLLALITYGELQFTTYQISSILETEVDRIESLVESSNILNSKNGKIIIEPESLNSFVKKNIHKKYEKIILEKIVAFLLSNQETDPEFNNNLYKYYFRLEKHNDVLNLLSPVFCTEIVRKTSSVKDLDEYSDIGMESASQTSNYNEIMRFSLLKSVLSDRSIFQSYALEIETKLTILDVDGAFNLANSAFLLEDRLRLFALIMNRLNQKNISIPEEVRIKLKEIISIINIAKSPQTAIETINLLIDVEPLIAIDILEKFEINNKDKNIIDWALSQISLQKITKLDGGDEYENKRNSEVVDKLSSRIENRELKDFVNSIKKFSQKKDTGAILDLIELYDQVPIKIMLLRMWFSSNTSEENLHLVISRALDIIVAATDFVLNASVLYDISKPLKSIQLRDERNFLIKRIRNLTETDNCKKPSIDYVKLLIQLIEAEQPIDYSEVQEKYNDVLAFLDTLSDGETELEGLAIVIESLSQFERKDNALNELLEELKGNLISKIRNSFNYLAAHEDLFKRVFSVLIHNNLEYIKDVLKLIEEVNTQYRRDDIYIILMAYYIDSDRNVPDNDFLEKIYQKLSNNAAHKNFLEVFFVYLDPKKPRFESFEINRWVSRAEKFNDQLFLLDVYCSAINYYSMKKCFPDEVKSISWKMKKILKGKEDDLDKIHTIFYLIKHLSTEVPDLVADLIHEIARIKAERPKLHLATYPLILNNTALLNRVLIGLLGRVENNYDDYLNFTLEMINANFPDSGQLQMYVDLAERFYLENEKAIFNKIVEKYIKVILEKYRNIPDYFEKSFVKAASCIFNFHRGTFENYLALVQNEDGKKRICLRVIEFTLKKCSSFDECEKNHHQASISFEECVDIVHLLKVVTEDYLIASVIDPLTERIHSNKKHFTREQLKDLNLQLNEIIEGKLPDANNIQHDGYRIYLKTMLLQIESRKDIVVCISDLNKAASNIPNISDQVFVKTLILKAMSKLNGIDEKLIKKIVNDVELEIVNISTFEERISRLEFFVSTLFDLDRSICKKYLDRVFKEVYESENNLLETQKNFIDLAYKIDPKMAENFVSLYDNDPARLDSKKELNSHLRMIKSKNDMDIDNLGDLQMLPLFSAILHRELNSNKRKPKSFKQLAPFLKKTSDLSFEKSYPTYALVIENLIKKYKGSGEANEYLIGVFNNLKFSLEVISVLEQNDIVNNNNFVPQRISSALAKSIIIKAGERSKAEAWLRNWLTDYTEKELIIIDPFFGKEDIQIIKTINDIKPDVCVKVLSGYDEEMRKNTPKLKEEFQIYWDTISLDPPPPNEFNYVGRKPDKVCPFHDRYWFSPPALKGIRLGASYNFLGVSKDSEISILDEDQISQIYKDLIEFYILRKCQILDNGTRLEYEIFVI